MDIMIREKLSSIQVAKMVITYWSVRSSSRRGKDGVKGDWERGRFFSQLNVFFRVHSGVRSKQ